MENKFPSVKESVMILLRDLLWFPHNAIIHPIMACMDIAYSLVIILHSAFKLLRLELLTIGPYVVLSLLHEMGARLHDFTALDIENDRQDKD